MDGLLQKHRLKSLTIGIEPTGPYWWNLASWLKNKDIHVVLVNPAMTKRNKENRENCPSKSDPKDALVIAEVVSRAGHRLSTTTYDKTPLYHPLSK